MLFRGIHPQVRSLLVHSHPQQISTRTPWFPTRVTPHLILDGTLISCDRVAGTNGKSNEIWYSGKAQHFAGNIQFLASPDSGPVVGLRGRTGTAP